MRRTVASSTNLTVGAKTGKGKFRACAGSHLSQNARRRIDVNMGIEKEFSVVLRSEPHASVGAVAEALAAARGVPVLDTMREARLGWGIVGDKLSDPVARKIVSELENHGIGAFCLATGSLPAVPPIQIANRIDLSNDGFRCRLASGTTPVIPWQASLFVAAGIVKSVAITKTTRKEEPSSAGKIVRMGVLMTTGIPLPGGKAKSVEVRKEETSLIAVVDIGLEKPACRFRLAAEQIDFSSLGDRRVYDSLGNFRILVGDIASHAPPDRLNHGVRVIQRNAPLLEMGYETLDDLEREERWMLSRMLA